MFKGSFTALITPFRNGALDEEAFRRFVEWQISEGTHGLVPVGTTGESPTLNYDEHKRVVELTVETAKGRVPVIAGTGSNSTDEAIELTDYAEEGRRRRRADRHALLQQADAGRPLPALQGDQRRGRHPDRHLQHSRPLGRRHDGRHDDALLRAEERRRRQGCDRQPRARLAAARWRWGRSSIMLSGEDATALGFMAHGGHGCISVVSNVAPRLCAEFQNALPRRRLQDGARAAGSPHAAARRDVLRDQSRVR